MKKNITQLVISSITGLLLFSSCNNQKETTAQESQFYTDSIYSQNLETYRKQKVYLPVNFSKERQYPIVYSTDGDEKLSYEFIRKTLDSLISNEVIEPIIFIGSYANTKEVPNSSIQTEDGQVFTMHYRLFEYVEPDPQYPAFPGTENLFTNHMKYFKDELIPSVEAKFNQTPGPKNRSFYGYSNGAGFGANLLEKHPELIKTYICFSTLGSAVNRNDWSTNRKYPMLYLQYGSEEDGGFISEAEGIRKIYSESNSPIQFNIYKGGHEVERWNESLQDVLVDRFKLK